MEKKEEKLRWSTLKKLLRNALKSAELRGDEDAIKRYKRMLKDEVKD